MRTHAVWLHGDGVGDVREDADGVSSALAVDEPVALEVKAVDVCLRAQAGQVPRYCVALTHPQAWEVPIHIPIDRCNRATETGKNAVTTSKVDIFPQREELMS